MSSLTETAYYTRRAINWTIVAFIAYLILRLFWSLLVSAIIALFPTRPAPPNHLFGKLPPLVFPEATINPAPQLTFTLETITGSLPQASESARVYFMPKAAANLLAISKTQEFAKRLELDITPIQEDRTTYRFDDSTTPIRKMRYDIVSGNFILRYGYEQDIGLFSEGKPQDTKALEREAEEILDDLGLAPFDYIHGTRKITLLKLVGNVLMPIQNLSQADAVRVDFFRNSVNRFGVTPPNPTEGHIRILFSGSEHKKKHVLEIVYTHWPIDQQSFGTYELRPVADAWQQIQNGGGYIARYPVNASPNVVIRTIRLGYYDSYDPQPYLQPIYIFEGDYEFAGYVPAIAPEWIE